MIAINIVLISIALILVILGEKDNYDIEKSIDYAQFSNRAAKVALERAHEKFLGELLKKFQA